MSLNVNGPKEPLRELQSENFDLREQVSRMAEVAKVYEAFLSLPRACNYTLELYWDGSGQIINNVPVNTLCDWDDLAEARAAIERLRELL